jgi:hypothetical protein
VKNAAIGWILKKEACLYVGFRLGEPAYSPIRGGSPDHERDFERRPGLGEKD